jgi:hypothetical protein
MYQGLKQKCKSLCRTAKGAITKLAPGAFSPAQKSPNLSSSTHSSTWARGKCSNVLKQKNIESLKFEKNKNKKLFFKCIGRYAATCHIIHVQVPLDLSKVFNQIQTITDTYKILEDKQIEQFKSIVKSIMDISLNTIKPSMSEIAILKQMNETGW